MSTASRILFVTVVAFVLLGAAVEARADLNISVAPNPVPIAQGGSGEITISSQILPGFPANAERIEYTLTNFAGGTGVGAATTLAPSFPPTWLMIFVNSTTAPGNYPATISAVARDAAGNVVGTKDFPGAVTIAVAPAPCSFQLRSDTARLSVPQGGTARVAISASASGGCSGVFTFSATAPAGVTVDSPQSTTFPAASVTFTYSASATAPPGQYSTVVTVQGGGTSRNITLPFDVIGTAPPPDFTLAVAPPAGALVAGQTATVTATITPQNGFNSPVSVAVSAPNDAVRAAPVTLTSPYAAAPITLQLNSAGSVPVTFTATGGTVQKTATLVLNVQPAQTPAFDLQVSPSDLALIAGDSGTVNVRASGSGGFSGTVTVTSPSVSEPNVGVTFTPQTFTLAAGESRPVSVAVSPSSRATALALEFRGVSGSLNDSAPLRLTIAARPVSGTAPSIQAITPMAYAPMPAQELIIIGRNFAPGATASIQQPETGSIEVAATRYISPTQLGVTVAVRAGTPAGRGYRVTVRNADGAATAEPVMLVVSPQGSLGGPAAVTRVAIEYPIRGQVIAAGKGSIAAAHLATSGTGTVTGRWRLRQSGNQDDPGFVFDQFTATVSGGFMVNTDRPCFDSAGQVKTTAHVCASIPMLHRGTYHLELLVDHPQLVTPASVPVMIQSDSATELTVYRPRAGSTVDEYDPEFSWTQLPGVAQYLVEFVRVAGEDEPVVALTFESPRATWRPDLRDLRKHRGLAPGTYRWRVVAVYPGDLRGQATEWLTVTFAGRAFTSARLVATVASAELTSVDTAAPEGGAGGSSPSATYTLSPNATLTGARQQNTAGQFTISSQGELVATGATSKITADLNYAGSSDPRRLVQESRNWIVDAGTAPERAYGLGAQFGYTTPDFTSGAEFLTSGSAQTGVIGRARSRFGTFSYYQPVSTAVHGVMSGVDENLEIRSAAFETPEGRPYTLRLIALEVEEPGDEDFGVIGSRLRTLGMYARYDASPLLSLVGEIAQGRVSAEQSGDGRNGLAARVGLSGSKGTFNYSANLRSVGANFVNPANRGLTPGGVSDRIMFDLNVGKTVGRAMLNLGVRRQDQGRSGESTMPRANETGVNLGLSTMLAGFSMNVAANFTGSRGEGNVEMYFPASHRDSSGLSTTLSRRFGRLNLSQTLSLQRTTDAINPLADQTMTSAGLSANGTFFTNLTLNATLSGNRMKGAEGLGSTNTWTASLQPSLAVPLLHIAFQPSMSLTRSSNSTLAQQSENEQYNLSLQWSPEWLGNLVAAQVTSSWSRSGAGGFEGDLLRSYAASVTVRMNKQRGMAWFPTGPLAGTMAPAAPEPVRETAAPASEAPAGD